MQEALFVCPKGGTDAAIQRQTSDIIPIRCFDTDITSRSFSAAAIFNLVAVLDIVLAVIIFQPQIEALASERSHAVQITPVAVRGVKIRCRTFKPRAEANQLFVIQKADDVAVILFHLREIVA